LLEAGDGNDNVGTATEGDTRGNATVAVLLVTSVLRALQELQELAEASEEP
jgi:hypothetical protein